MAGKGDAKGSTAAPPPSAAAAAAGAAAAEDEESAAMLQRVREGAAAAAQSTQKRLNAFDSEVAQARAKAEVADAGMGGGAESLSAPSTMPGVGQSDVSQPTVFRGSLKAYQLKGLQWLANLYDQVRDM